MDNRLEYREAAGTGREPAADPGLNATEIAALWATHQEYSMMACFYKHFLSHVADRDIRAVLEFAMDIAQKRVTWVMDTLSKEKLPPPTGFTDEDVREQAPRLYSDPFYLHFLINKAKIALEINSFALTTSARPDIRKFYEQCCASTVRLYQKATDLSLANGFYIRPPYVATARETDFVQKQSFLAGYFGPKRPLLAMEISSLFHGILTNSFGKEVLTGFRQVAGDAQVRHYIDRGIKLAGKIIDMHTSVLRAEDIPVSMEWDTLVTDSTFSPFSDRLMVTLVLYMNAAGVVNNATAISTNFRRDLASHYTRAMADTVSYAEDGVNLMIKNGWLEEPPRVADRRSTGGVRH